MLEVKLESHLKLHMLINLLVLKIEQYFYVALEGAPKTFFEEHSELHNNLKKKIHFEIEIDI